MTTTHFFLLWLFCAPVGYIVTRWSHFVTGATKWTKMNRFGVIVFALVGGPVAVIFSAVIAGLCKLMDTPWAKENAKW